MSQIRRLLDALVAAPGAELRIAADAPITLLQQGVETTMTKAPLSAEQWKGVVLQLVPPFAFPEFESTGSLRSVLPGNGASFEVELTKDASGAGRATIRVAVPALDVEPLRAAAGLAQTAPAQVRARETMERLLRLQMETGASDLHLRSGCVPLARRSGDMCQLEGEAVLSDSELAAMIDSVIPERPRQEYADTRDADFAYEIDGVGRFRLNAFVDRNGPGVVSRSIPTRIVTADELGLSAEVRALTQLTKGLVLVTGPTGSGKSTTLSALVDLVNASRRDHIVTIEDPIEFVHHSKGCLITQRQVGAHTRSFKQALRAALREDPDVVLVGELRDLETVSIAIETAETGHLVFGTLHTSTAMSTVDRIIDQFPPDRQSQVRVMLSESLKGVISQTLCRKIGGGRVAAMEILLVTPALSNLIREGKTFQMTSIMQTSKKLGMVTLTDALMGLVEKKLIEPEEAYLRSPDKAGIVAALKSKGFNTAFAEIEAEKSSTPAATRAPATAGARR
jgi:twitching motility protein PilT